MSYTTIIPLVATLTCLLIVYLLCSSANTFHISEMLRKPSFTAFDSGKKHNRNGHILKDIAIPGDVTVDRSKQRNRNGNVLKGNTLPNDVSTVDHRKQRNLNGSALVGNMLPGDVIVDSGKQRNRNGGALERNTLPPPDDSKVSNVHPQMHHEATSIGVYSHNNPECRFTVWEESVMGGAGGGGGQRATNT